MISVGMRLVESSVGVRIGFDMWVVRICGSNVGVVFGLFV